MVEGAVTDPETGCTFANSNVLDACVFADEQEHYEQPCKEGFDTYTYGEKYSFSDATLIYTAGEVEQTWGQIKAEAMRPGFNQSVFFDGYNATYQVLVQKLIYAQREQGDMEPLAISSAGDPAAAMIGMTQMHPFIQRCMQLCNIDAARESPKISLDPHVNKMSAISNGAGFTKGTDCYY
jgi:hypothetical protein